MVSVNIKDEVLKELGLDHLQGEERQKTLETLENRFNDVILNAVLAHISPQQFERLKEALHSENPEKGVASITSQVPGLGEVIEERLMNEYRMMKTVMQGSVD